ncbi:uncharacterized protein LOC106646704 [Copidosoma floridanum]|uniref:uncharacterized protein LOC106646704 n=1 Tax=Copidosoma floridanum TaxID=29053 RepID=UPI0006C99E36|nr:uncharacterized protein LOC106646704 [Copidosoma floridanum]
MDVEEILIDDDDFDDIDIEILNVGVNEDSPSPDKNKPILKNETVHKNPVEEHLMKQLNCARNQIDQAKSNIEVIQNVTQRIVQNLSSKAAYRDNTSSDSDGDVFSSCGEPIAKKKKNKYYEKRQVLVVQKTWQRVIDDKWIIGVVLQSSTTCTLRDLTIYVSLKNREDDSHGVSVFWTLVDDTFWYPTEEIDSEEQLVATAVLDLPSFDAGARLEAQGTVFCQFDDKLFQTPVPNVELTVHQTVDGTCAVDLEDPDEAQFSILALKAISVDRVILLPWHQDSSIGKRLMKFLGKYAFKEICKVCVVRNTGSLQYCVLEVLPADEDGDVRVLLSARSEAQLSVVVQLLRMDFPEMIDVEKQQAMDEAAEVLRNELKLYLSCTDAVKLQRARIKTDLLIP